ncbi:MAG: amidohydrolase family protein [Ruminococcus sp.]|nr:amidohydrolase family protein [Ruminococcus sp.]
MVIDFHTHTFPDKMAEKTVAHLAKIGGLPPHTDGKRGSLLESMNKYGIDRSVVLPVATLPKQERSINALSAELNGKDGIFYAGGIHPDCGDVCGTLDFIKRSGLFGIKLHPDYQGVHFDDPRYINIMREAAKRGLYIVTHAGIDVGFRDHVHCTPDMILNVLGQLEGVIDNRLILAHMGSYEMPDEVLCKLCGKPVYMDTAAVLDLYPDKCVEIIRKHGADRILFATDSPWKSQGEYLGILESLPLSESEKEKILHENAERILSVK